MYNELIQYKATGALKQIQYQSIEKRRWIEDCLEGDDDPEGRPLMPGEALNGCSFHQVDTTKALSSLNSKPSNGCYLYNQVEWIEVNTLMIAMKSTPQWVSAVSVSWDTPRRRRDSQEKVAVAGRQGSGRHDRQDSLQRYACQEGEGDRWKFWKRKRHGGKDGLLPVRLTYMGLAVHTIEIWTLLTMI